MTAMLYTVAHGVIPPLARAVWRPVVEGLHHVPATGPVIVASNHLSFFDSIVIPLASPRHVAFLAKQEYFTGPGPRGWVTKKFFQATNQLPMDRSGGEASLRSLDAGLEALREGRLLGGDDRCLPSGAGAVVGDFRWTQHQGEVLPVRAHGCIACGTGVEDVSGQLLR